MSTTNQTAHYGLPLFYGDDKADWSDLTRAFTIIDEALYSLQSQIDKQGRDFEKELHDAVVALNTRIDTEVATLNSRIDSEVSDLNDRITGEVADLNDRITTEVATINATIESDLQNVIYYDTNVVKTLTSAQYSKLRIN